MSTEEKKPGVCTMSAPEPDGKEAREVIALDRDAILAAPDAGEVVYVEVPEWGKDVAVAVRQLSGKERDAFEADQAKRKKTGRDLDNFEARMCALVLSDAEGNALLNWRNGEHVSALGNKAAAALQRIMNVGMELNGWTEEDVEGLEKNSGSGQSEDSGTD